MFYSGLKQRKINYTKFENQLITKIGAIIRSAKPPAHEVYQFISRDNIVLDDEVDFSFLRSSVCFLKEQIKIFLVDEPCKVLNVRDNINIQQ